MRAAFPLAVLALWPISSDVGPARSEFAGSRYRRDSGSFTGWCASSPVSMWSHGSTSHTGASPGLLAFAASEIYMQERRDSLDCAVALNRLTWLLCSIVLITVVWVGRGALLAETATGISGYGISNRLPTVGGMPMVRATGIARLAAVPALLSFVWLWNTRGVARTISVAVLVPTLYLVWVMQSRGATVSFAFAASFVLILMGGTARRTGVLLATLLGTIFLLDFIPNDTIHHAYLYATRGEEGWRYPRCPAGPISLARSARRFVMRLILDMVRKRTESSQ